MRFALSSRDAIPTASVAMPIHGPLRNEIACHCLASVRGYCDAADGGGLRRAARRGRAQGNAAHERERRGGEARADRNGQRIAGAHRADAHRRGAPARLRHRGRARVRAGQPGEAKATCSIASIRRRSRFRSTARRRRCSAPRRCRSRRASTPTARRRCASATSTSAQQREMRSRRWLRPMPMSQRRRRASRPPSSTCNIPRSARRSPAASAAR